MAAELYNDWYISARWSEVGPSTGSASSEQQHNADKIYTVLNGLGWTVNAIAAAIGNMQVESGLDPACAYPMIGNTIADIGNTAASNYPDNAYGLVQWKGRGSTDPNNNQLVGYAIRYGYEWYDGDIQMNRLTWEYQTPAKFHPQNVDGVYWTFPMFAASTETPSVLAKVWMVCYEGTYSVLTNRQANAEYWYNYFSGEPPQPVEEWISGTDFSTLALAYDPSITGIDIPYSTWDCIAFVNAVWQDIPVVAQNGWSLTNGTNSLWRSTRTFQTTSPDQQNPTPELWMKDTISNFLASHSELPAGCLLFHQIDEEGPPPIPSEYAGDGIGNFVHVGIYCGDNTVMQSGGRDSAAVPGGGVHRSIYDSEAWNYLAYVVYVNPTAEPPGPGPEPGMLPRWLYLWYSNNRRRIVKNVKKYF